MTKEYFVIATSHRVTEDKTVLVYFEGFENGQIWFVDVLKAKRFESMAEALDFVKEHQNWFGLGFSLIEIFDVTFDAIEKSFKGDGKLYEKFHNPTYALA